jgi:undecaprenyl-diphosphatase
MTSPSAARDTMAILHALVLGIVQGLTEFLPISSSGHLLIVPWLFDWRDFDDPAIKKAFDVALHAGTLFAVAGYFRRDIAVHVRAALGSIRSAEPVSVEARIAWFLVMSSVPAAIAGALFEAWIDDTLGTPTIIGATLIVFAIVLAMADRRDGRRSLEDMTWKQAAGIGLAQVLALNPGTSRSGVTISAGRFFGLDRWSAARFSFLMSLPITAGAVVFKVGGLIADGLPPDFAIPMAIGVGASAVSGWVAVAGLLRLVRTRTFGIFVIYRILVGTAILFLVASPWR